MRRVIMKSCEIETLDSLVRIVAFRDGRKFFVATEIDGNELVREAPSKEAALLTLAVQVIAVRNLAKR